MAKDGHDSVMSTLIYKVWQFGIDPWTQRNQTKHGKGYGLLVEMERAKRGTMTAYQKYVDFGSYDIYKWIFEMPVEERLEGSNGTMIAWIELSKKLYAHFEIDWFKLKFTSASYREFIEHLIHSRRLTL